MKPSSLFFFILLSLALLTGCDKSTLSVEDGQFQGYAMTFDLPEGFVDIHTHPDHADSYQAEQIGLAGGIAAIGEPGEHLPQMINLLPVGPADGLEMNLENCEHMSQRMAREFSSRVVDKGLPEHTEVIALASPGNYDGTDCEFMIALGDGQFHSKAVFFTQRYTLFVAGCEADTEEEARRLCDHLFERWTYQPTPERPH